jgi:hypothetical protein
MAKAAAAAAAAAAKKANMIRIELLFVTRLPLTRVLDTI